MQFSSRERLTEFVLLSRPSDSGHTPFGDIFLSESPDMLYWGKHRHVMGKSPEWWESVKIGGGAAPIETSEGWLLFYHGVTGTCNGYVYSIGGAILDIDNPSVVKYRCENFLLTPEEWYEERGFVPNVTFRAQRSMMLPQEELRYIMERQILTWELHLRQQMK